ncbi:MAG: type II toxin-antitoxin system VapC family toxin [Gaiellaceae bacterium]
MATVYVDTSALARVLTREPDGAAVLEHLSDFDRQISSRLLRVELRRVAFRQGVGEAAEELLSDIALVPLDDAVLAEAEAVPPRNVATLDAIHLATALRLVAGGDLDALMTYDAQLAAGAEHHGIRVIAPAG